MRRLAVLGAVIAVAVVAAACLPPAPEQTAPAPTTTVKPAVAKGFDACAAPSLTTMGAWWGTSPYTSVGVYIGGANRGCAQPNLTPSWVQSVWAKGWKLLPLWVGPQAPCTTLTNTTKITADPNQAYNQGATQANAAADAANYLGLPGGAPIYFDLEAYPRGGTCTQSVINFTDGWVRTLNYRGYNAAMYSSLCSGILDQAAAVADPSRSPLNAVWIAAWNNTPNIYGFAPCGSTSLSDLLWNRHQRVHQYTGGHNEAYGGITINVDSNAVDGPTVP